MCFCDVFENSFQPNDVAVYTENKKFGLQIKNSENITKAQYKKLIRIGENGIFLAQKGSHLGLIDYKGEIIVPFKNNQAERVFTNVRN